MIFYGDSKYDSKKKGAQPFLASLSGPFPGKKGHGKQRLYMEEIS